MALSCVRALARLRPAGSLAPTSAFASSVGAVRSYYPRPLPAADRQDVLRHALRGVPAGKAVPARSEERAKPVYSLSYKLSEVERSARGKAERRGYLEMVHAASQGLVNHYFQECVNWRRPYMALHRDGGSVEVDLSTMVGLIKKPEALVKAQAAQAAVLAALKSAVAAEKHAQVVNPATLKTQAEQIVTGPKEGSNALKLRDAEPSLTCTVYVTDRNSARRVVEAVHAAYCAASGHPTPAAAAEKAAAARVQKARTHSLRMVRQLRKLVADPLAVKNLRVEAGAVDGFVTADREGRANFRALELLADDEMGSVPKSTQ